MDIGESFSTGATITEWGKNSLFSKWLGKVDSHMQRQEAKPLPSTIDKNQSKMTSLTLGRDSANVCGEIQYPHLSQSSQPLLGRERWSWMKRLRCRQRARIPWQAECHGVSSIHTHTPHTPCLKRSPSGLADVQAENRRALV